MKPQIHSILEQISEQVFKMTNLEQAKKFVTEFVEGKGINEKDKQSILNETKNTKSLVAFQRYLCNALLKYEGLGMNKMNKTAREAAADTAFE